MADAKTFANDNTVSGAYQPLDASLTALAGVTTAANKLTYATASDTFATTDFTAYGRTLVALADAAALKSALSVVTSTASSLAASGYVSLDLSGDGTADITLQWGTATLGAAATFPANFTSACWTVVYSLGGNIGQSDEADEIHYLSAVSTSGFTTSISGDYSSAPSIYWFAVGK